MSRCIPLSLAHLLSQSLRLLLIGCQLFLPLLHVSVSLVQGGHQLGVTVLQSEELRLQVQLADGPERGVGVGGQLGMENFYSMQKFLEVHVKQPAAHAGCNLLLVMSIRLIFWLKSHTFSQKPFNGEKQIPDARPFNDSRPVQERLSVTVITLSKKEKGDDFIYSY